MSESLTGDSAQSTDGLNQEPTGQEVQNQNPAETQNQDTNSGEQSQEAVSDDSSAQQQIQKEESGTEVTDDGLARFAKSQGIEDVSQLDETSQRLLKIAHDNVREKRTEMSKEKVSDVTKTLQPENPKETVAEKALREINQFRYEQQTNQFWSQPGDDGKPIRDRSIEPTMVKILNDAKEKHGADYAQTLSQDLDTLYDMARLRSGAVDPSAAKEQGRREERDSINRKAAAGAPQAHAVSQSTTTPVIDAEWIEKEYDPNNPEHRALVDGLARRDLY